MTWWLRTWRKTQKNVCTLKKTTMIFLKRSNLHVQMFHERGSMEFVSHKGRIFSPQLHHIWISHNYFLFVFVLKQNNALSLLLLHMSVCWHYICFMLLCNPVISFTWHPHGQHYMNICELHLEAFLHVKCLAVSLLQGEGPFAVTNQVSLLHLHPDTTKRRVQPQTANVGKSLCWKVGDFINSTQ